MIRPVVLAFSAVFWLSLVTAQAAENEKVLLGYVHGMPANINYKLYTHLCHAFVVAEKDGTLISRPNVPSAELTKAAHEEGVKVLLSLGGWGWDANFAEMSLNPAAENRYIASVMKLVEKDDYDGVDLDWEYPDTNIEIAGFERLARKFRQELTTLGKKTNRPMLLTMAAAAHPKTLAWLDREFLLETMDWINVMTYDYFGSWSATAGHHSAMFVSSRMSEAERLSTESSIGYLLERKLPPDRIVLGIPLYGRAFAVGQPYADASGAAKPSRESYNYREIVSFLEKGGWTRQWDQETKNPWLVARDGSEVVCYDDAESIALKTRWAMEQGLRGVFFWQIAGDRMPDGTNPLQEAANKILLKED